MSQGFFFFNTPASLQKIYSFLMQLHLLLANYQTTWRLLLLLFRQVYFRIMSDLHIVPQDSLCLHLSLSLHCTVTVTAGKHPLSGRCLLSGKPSVCLQLRRKRCFHWCFYRLIFYGSVDECAEVNDQQWETFEAWIFLIASVGVCGTLANV